MDPKLRARLSLFNPWHFLALGFGSGLAPVMPGTFGTLAGLPLAIGLGLTPDWLYALATTLACIVGIRICGKTAEDMQVHDHGAIVWDEVAGILITFILVPLSLTTVVLGFLLFRLFDIVKPWPISYLDKHIHGGRGIMIDDIVAGIFACACLHGLLIVGVI